MKILTKYPFLLLLFLYSSLFCFSQTQKSNLPTLYINTENRQAVTSKTTYLPAQIIIKSSDPSEELNVVTEIRGRGNSTWGFSKKPYRIKLDKKQRILNLPANAKSWTLLANYADKTLMRNALAFKISEVVGLEFSPSARFVDLVLNDRFLGNYMISDQVQVGENRVDIDELTANDVDDNIITGGYLLEIDGFAASEAEWFTTASKGLKITIKSPDETEINNKQRQYITDFINDFESRLFSANFKDPLLGYRDKADTSSLVNWYIACELTGNSDSFWSTYIYKKRAVDKLFFGPMWDYDIAFNNDNRLGDATRKLMREYAHSPRAWVERLAQDEWFQNAVWRRWNELLEDNLLTTLTDYVDEQALLLEESQTLNFNLWGNVSNRVYLEFYLFNTYSQGIDYLKTYLSSRISFLTNSFKYVEPAKPSEVFVSDNAYYMIMNKRSNNVIDLSNGSMLDGTDLVLWEPISEDNSQLWEIIQIGNDRYRIVNKQSGLAIEGNGKNRNLIQKAISNNDAQKWTIVPVNTGNVYCLVNVASDYSMNNSGGQLANGTAVIEYDNGIVFNGEYNTIQSENRQWYLQKVEMKGSAAIRNANIIESFAIYPNPVSDYFKLRINLAGSSNINLSLYTLLGEKVLERLYPNSVQGESIIEISANDLDSGIYLLHLSSDKGDLITLKLIVNKSGRH